MKKIKITILVGLLAVTMSMPCIAYAYGDYTNYTKNGANIGTAGTSLTMDNLTNYYYDSSGTYASRDKNSIAISFTDDMKSSLSSYAKIKTYADSLSGKYPASYLFDAGNFSMGNPYQTIFESEATELRIMGNTGYDAATLGSAELSHGAGGLAAMLNRAAKSGDTVPKVVAANITGSTELENAFKKYGVEDYIVVNEYGVKVAVFGIIGKDSFDSASASGIKLADPVESARNVVSEIKKKENVDMIVCLANTGNGGNDTKQSEASQIAKSVDGIDLIVTGNNTNTLTEPVTQNGTEIVSTGEGSGEIGTVIFTKSGSSYKYKSYKLTKLNGSITDNSIVSARASSFKNLYNSAYFSKYGFTYGEKLTNSDFDFPSVSSLMSAKGDNPLGDIIADAYKSSSGSNSAIGVVSAGAVTGTIYKGNVTGGDAFGVLSKGTGNDGKAGYQLLSVKLTGSQIRALAEAGSKPSDSKTDKKLYFGGLKYTYNPHRIATNKVYDIKASGESSKFDNKKSYTVITDEYTYNAIKTMLGKNASAELKDKLMYRNDGNELKAWSSLAGYLKNQGSSISSEYKKADGRATYDSSFNPINLFKQPNKMVGVVVSVAVIAIAIILLLIIFIFGGVGRRRYKGFEPRKHGKKHYPKQSKQKPIFSNKKRF